MLASALVTAVACGLESARGNAEASLRRAIGATDARLVNRFGAPFAASEAERVRALPGVDAVGISLAGSLSLVRADGAVDAEGRVRRVVAQARGLESGGDPRFRMQEMREGRLPERMGEIAIDPMTATALDCGMGAKLEVQRFGEPIALEVTGIIDRATLGALQRPYVVVERATLVEASGSDDASTVLVALEEGTPVLEWVATHAPTFEEPLALEPSELFTTGFDRQVRAMRLGFVLVSLVAFMSCAFIVGTGMTTAVAEQQKELAIARCVGASRGQVFMSQVWAGAALCGAAGAAGVPVGIALAAALRWWFRDFLSDGFFLSGWGVGLSLAGSLVAGVAGALWPAWQASRTSPLAALAPQVRAPRLAGIGWLALAGVLCIAAQVAMLFAVPGVEAKFWSYATAGLPLIHAGWFMLAVPVLWIVAQPMAPLLERVLAIPRGLLSGAVHGGRPHGGRLDPDEHLDQRHRGRRRHPRARALLGWLRLQDQRHDRRRAGADQGDPGHRAHGADRVPPAPGHRRDGVRGRGHRHAERGVHRVPPEAVPRAQPARLDRRHARGGIAASGGRRRRAGGEGVPGGPRQEAGRPHPARRRQDREGLRDRRRRGRRGP
jgi:hypothetical protein